MAMMHFDASDCDALVIEVGLGGRLDSTNVFAPSVSVVTSIGLDHQHVLGHDLAVDRPRESRHHQAGRSRGQWRRRSARRRRSFTERAEQSGSKLYWLGRDFTYQSEPLPDWGSSIQYSGITPPLRPQSSLTLAMEGQHQARNAAIAMAAIDLLRGARRSRRAARLPTPITSRSDAGPVRPRLATLPPATIESAFSQLQCDARIEHVRLGWRRLGDRRCIAQRRLHRSPLPSASNNVRQTDRSPSFLEPASTSPPIRCSHSLAGVAEPTDPDPLSRQPSFPTTRSDDERWSQSLIAKRRLSSTIRSKPVGKVFRWQRRAERSWSAVRFFLPPRRDSGCSNSHVSRARWRLHQARTSSNRDLVARAFSDLSQARTRPDLRRIATPGRCRAAAAACGF